MKKLSRALLQAGGGTTARLTRLGTVLAVSTLSVLMVGSVLALLTDSITLAGGTVASNDWDDLQQPPPANELLDLRIKQGPCEAGDDPTDTMVFSDDAVTGFTSMAEQFDLAAIAAGQIDTYAAAEIGELCFHNASAYAGELDVTILGVSSVEMGDCGDAELAGETDIGATGCTAGSQGELHNVTSLSLSNHPTFECPTQSAQFRLNHGGSQTVLRLEGGQSCSLLLNMRTDHFSVASITKDPALLAALSDSLTLDLAFDLHSPISTLGEACDDGDPITTHDQLIDGWCQGQYDQDGDGVDDHFDNCTEDLLAGMSYNPDQADFDGDGTGDICDTDIDGDGVQGGEFDPFATLMPGMDMVDCDDWDPANTNECLY